MSSSEEEMIRRIRSDMLDSYDEELEMELDDHNQDELADGLSPELSAEQKTRPPHLFP